MIIDLDASQPDLALAGEGLYALLFSLHLQASVKAQALDRPGFDVFPMIELADELVLAISRHVGEPRLVPGVMMVLSMLSSKGSEATIDCLASPDLGLGIALCKHFDALMIARLPHPTLPGATVSYLGALVRHFQQCLAGQPYTLGKVLADDFLRKFATALVDHSKEAPVTNRVLIDIITTELDKQPKLRRKHRAKIDEGVGIALAGLPNEGPTIGVRAAWMALGGRQPTQPAPTSSIGPFVPRVRLADHRRRSRLGRSPSLITRIVSQLTVNRPRRLRRASQSTRSAPPVAFRPRSVFSPVTAQQVPVTGRCCRLRVRIERREACEASPHRAIAACEASLAAAHRAASI